MMTHVENRSEIEELRKLGANDFTEALKNIVRNKNNQRNKKNIEVISYLVGLGANVNAGLQSAASVKAIVELVALGANSVVIQYEVPERFAPDTFRRNRAEARNEYLRLRNLGVL